MIDRPKYLQNLENLYYLAVLCTVGELEFAINIALEANLITLRKKIVSQALV